jgi:hypothetical protein
MGGPATVSVPVLVGAVVFAFLVGGIFGVRVTSYRYQRAVRVMLDGLPPAMRSHDDDAFVGH